MVEAFGAVVVEADVVGGPAGSELVAAGGELADEVGEVAVGGVASGFGAQDGDGGVGDVVPVDEELAAVRVEEREPGEVRRRRRVGERRCEQGAAERVGGDDVEASVAHDGRGAGHGVEEALHARAGPAARLGRRRRRGRGVVGGAGEVEQVGAFGFVELQGAGDGFEDAVGDAGEVPAFEPGVVVDADPGEHGDLFAAQAGHAPVGAVGREPDILRGEAGAAGGEELAHVVPVVHAGHATTGPARAVGGSVVTWNSVHLLRLRLGARVGWRT